MYYNKIETRSPKLLYWLSYSKDNMKKIMFLKQNEKFKIEFSQNNFSKFTNYYTRPDLIMFLNRLVLAFL